MLTIFVWRLRLLLILGPLVFAVCAQVPIAYAGGSQLDAALYLSQAQPVLDDARMNIDSLQFYLPLGSLKDADDPTWNSAEEAAEALAADAGALRVLNLPESLTAVNSGLSDVLARASAGAESAVSSLSEGDVRGGQRALAAFNEASAEFDRLRNSLPSVN
jgi:hypothetical protein